MAESHSVLVVWNCTRQAQIRLQASVRTGGKEMDERFRVPLRHEPVACSSTTVVSVLVSFIPVRGRSPVATRILFAQLADSGGRR
jgi:hypothetical protein